MPGKLNLMSQRFGRLVVIAESGRNRHGATLWSTRCDCGKERTVPGGSLTGGNTTSCGCSRTKHGQARTPMYRLWRSMIKRCENPSDAGFKHYGARGVRVCSRWRRSFTAFVTDIGPRPSPRHTLDRYPDQSGNYEPTNIRWATWVEQANNKRNNHRLTVNGVTATVAEWSRQTGIKYTTIMERLRRGWSASRAVTVSLSRAITRAPAPG